MKVFEFAIFPYIQKQYQSMFKPVIEKYAMTQVEIDVLAFLHNNPEYKHAQDIVKIRGINKGHASIAVDKLVEKGLLQRIPDPHCRRCNLLLLTKQAEPMIKDIVAIQRLYRQRLYHHISPEERKTFDQVLYQMYINLGGYHDE